MGRAVAAAAGIGVYLALFAVPAPAVAGEFLGVSKGGQPLNRRDVRELGSSGAHTLRFALNWNKVQPRRGAPRLGATDALVGSLAANGVRSAPFIYGSPRWVARYPNGPPLGNPSKVRAWRAFLSVLVKRYGRGGTYWRGPYQRTYPGAAPLPITTWQIWNEPTLPKLFGGRDKARRYATLVRVSHQAITAVDPGARIVLAGLTAYARPTAWSFLDKLYRFPGIKRDFDAISLHPYATTMAQFRKAIRRTRRVMARHHDGRTALWLTEVGWGSARATRRFPLNKGLQGQKRMLSRSVSLVRRHRGPWHVERLFWFDWRDPARGADVGCSFCPSAGLLRHNHRPKPSYRVFARFARAS